jgi:hypothetical protein
VARFDDRVVDAIVDEAELENKMVDAELRRVLRGRRDVLLKRWLTRVSPLAQPEVVQREGEAELCLDDFTLVAGIRDRATRRYSARAFADHRAGDELAIPMLRADGNRVCVGLPRHAENERGAIQEYLVLEVAAADARLGSHALMSGEQSAWSSPTTLLVHVYYFGGSDYRVAGLERPE